MLINKNNIYFRKWLSPKSRAIVIAVHGMGGHSDRYALMAEFFKKKQISTYAIELRGYGELQGNNPGHVKSMNLYSEDIGVLKQIVKEENHNKPIFILGESMGAVVAHTTVVDFDRDYSGLIEIAPVYKDIMKISMGKRALIALTSLYNPAKGILMPFTTEELTRDKAIINKLNKDKRESKMASAGLLLGMMLREMKISLNEGKLHIPVLFMLAGHDMLGDTKYNMNLFKKIIADKELHFYKDSYHALTIEKNRNEVFKDIVGWINKKK
jgi:alpha-beta hydrolase superfamily lysophospholipase